jgi:hypothetical protein
MDQWLEDAKARINALKKAHHQQRIQLELSFETAPRDSRYSNTLIDMMRKEEQIVAKDPHSPVTKSIIQKVDDTLRAETRGFFQKTTQKNVKRWNMMKEKFDQETNQVSNGILDELRHITSGRAAGASSPPLIIPSSMRKELSCTPEQLDAEAERLEYDYNKNWYKYENFNLQEAFKSQNNRIENDWGVHEQALEDEYQAKREKIAGPQAAAAYGRSPLNSPGAQQHDPRWQHPEKQKTLIHTAPVLSPTRQQQDSSAAGGWGKGGKDNAAIAFEVYRSAC